MDTIDEGFGLGLRLAVHLAARSHILRHRAVGQEHKLLDEPVGLFGELLVHADGLSVFVDIHLHFRAVEVDSSGRKTLLAQLQSQFIENQDGFLHIGRNYSALGTGTKLLLHRSVSGLDDGLGQLVVETVVRNDVGAAEPGIDDLGLGCYLKDGREG